MLKTGSLPDQIVPDVLTSFTPGTCVIQITYPSAAVNHGNELQPKMVNSKPTVSWNTKLGQMYTLAMVDPDAPSRENPEKREFLHWLVCNIPGADVNAGEVSVDYFGSAPPQGTGLHRYIFVLCEQPALISPGSLKIDNKTIAGREKFHIQQFINNHKLLPVAVNYYKAQFDETVPAMYKAAKG